MGNADKMCIRDRGYPATCELDDGTLMTVYYQKQHPGENCSILYTRWKL